MYSRLSDQQFQRNTARWQNIILFSAMWICTIAMPFTTAAGTSDNSQGLSNNGFTGLSRIDLPTAPAPALYLGGSGSYGYTESMGPVEGAHHTMAGRLTLAGQIAPWLGVSLRVDGEAMFHPDDENGSDNSISGEPRLILRSGFRPGKDLMLGGEASIRVPGGEAPSLEWSATTVDFNALFAWAPINGRLAIASTAGFRLDNSANAAPDDLSRLRPGDRIALHASDFNAVLLGVGLSYRLRRVELIGEFTTDLLIGKDAPVSASPFRLDAGIRLHPIRALQISLMTETQLGARTTLSPSDPLVPIEPRFAVSLGLGAVFDFSHEAVTVPLPVITKTEPAKPAPEEVIVPLPPEGHTVTGQLTDADNLPAVGVNMTIVSGDFRATTTTDPNGQYSFKNVPDGTATFSATAEFFEDQTWTLDVSKTMPPAPGVKLIEKMLGSQVRGLIRAFSGEGLQVTVRLSPGEFKVETGKDGTFEIDVPPGKYQVVIRLKGYKSHRSSITVEENSVTILNVDLLRAKGEE